MLINQVCEISITKLYHHFFAKFSFKSINHITFACLDDIESQKCMTSVKIDTNDVTHDTLSYIKILQRI